MYLKRFRWRARIMGSFFTLILSERDERNIDLKYIYFRAEKSLSLKTELLDEKKKKKNLFISKLQKSRNTKKYDRSFPNKNREAESFPRQSTDLHSTFCVPPPNLGEPFSFVLLCTLQTLVSAWAFQANGWCLVHLAGSQKHLMVRI